MDGHYLTVSVEFSAKPSCWDAVTYAFRYLPRRATGSALNSPAPRRIPSFIWKRPDRPQPRKDAERERGMAAFVGRLRACPVLDYKFVVLGHNTIRGAAGAAVLNAELMHTEGMLLA